MSRKKRIRFQASIVKRKAKLAKIRNRLLFESLISFVLPEGAVFQKDEFHGNVQWIPEQLAAQALIWSWQDTKLVTDAFEKTLEICAKTGLKKISKTYTAFMNAINRYRAVFADRLRRRQQKLAEEIGGRYFRTNGWVLIAFDGSRATAPRSVANEKAYCAPNYGHGKEALYGKKKSQGLRRKRNKAHKTQPPEPQVWITMMWHMGLRLPWTWRLGPSNSSERAHVQQILESEEFPTDTLFCGDAGFVGYPIWKSIVDSGANFLVRVGANVNLLSERMDFTKQAGGIVHCWPKNKQATGDPPLMLRLVQVKIGKTLMWMLTSILSDQELSIAEIVSYYKIRWGVEVEFRGLKQTIDKHKLRCRNDGRLLAELDWSLRGMFIAELLALREQIPKKKPKSAYSVTQRSLANTLRVLRRCMRNLDDVVSPEESVMHELSAAVVQRYDNTTDKRARYRWNNPDIKPLGDPEVRKPTPQERKRIKEFDLKIAA